MKHTSLLRTIIPIAMGCFFISCVEKQEADDMMVEKFSRKDIVRSHQTLGELYIDLDHSNITEYRGELDIAKALATVSYKTNGDPVTLCLGIRACKGTESQGQPDNRYHLAEWKGG